MSVFTVRREINAFRPIGAVSRRLGISRLIAVAALAVAAGSTQAQVICPFPAFSGNNQTTLAGTKFPMPLTAGQVGATSPIPVTFPISWTVDAVPSPPTSVYFFQSLATSFTENVTWSAVPSSFSSSVEVVAPVGASGVYTVRAATSACPPMTDRTFNINVVAPTIPGVNPFQGSSQSAVSGNAFMTPLGAVVTQGSTATPVPNAKTTFRIVSGPATFSDGTTTFTTFSASDGHAFADIVALGGISVNTPVAVSVDALGVTQPYSGLMVMPAGTATVSHTPPESGSYPSAQNQQFSETFSVTILDGMGAPVSGATVNFQLAAGSAGSQLVNGASTVGTTFPQLTGVNGTASIRVRAGAPGTFSLTATTSTPVVSSVTWGLIATAGSQDLSILSGNGQTARPQTRFTEPLTVAALLGGSAAGGVPVTFTVVSGGAFFQVGNGLPTPSKTVSTTGAPPNATTDIFAGGVGQSIVQATSPGYQPVSFVLNVAQVDVETVIKTSGDAQQAPVNTTLPQPLVAGVTPSALASTPNGQIKFDILSGAATFVESGTNTYLATPSGPGLSAPVNLRLGTQPSDIQIQASFPGMLPAVFTARSVDVTNTTALIKISGDGQIATTGAPSAPLRVRLVRDGTPVSNADITWAVSVGNATVSAATTRTNDQGESQITLSVGADAGAIRVRVSAALGDQLPPATTDFALTSANATLIAVSGSGQAGAIGSEADQVFVFELRRADGTPLAGQTVQFAASSGTLTQASATTGSDGRVSVGLRYGASAGNVQVRASAFNGVISATGVANTFVPLLTIVSGNNQSAAAGASLTDPLVIQIARPPTASLAKGLQGLVVNWSVVSGGGVLGTATSLTDTNGRSSNTLRLGSLLGAQQVKATIAGVGEVVFSANGNIPANSVLEIVSGNNQQVVPRRPSAPMVVRLRTAAGTGLSGFVVRFTPSDGATVDPGEVTTGQDGRASTIVNVTLPGDYTITASVPSASNIAPVVFNLGNGIANLPELAGRGNRIARAIDKACPRLARSTNLSAAQQDLLQRCSELVVGARDSSGAVASALDTMLADESSSQNSAALASAAAQFENLKGRFAALRSGSRGPNFAGLAIVTPDGRLPFSFLPSSLLLGAADDQTAPISESFSRWGFFATGTIGRGSRDPNVADPGGDFDNYGLTAGIDYRMTDSFILGGALGFNSNDSALNQNLGGLESRGYSLSAYGTWFKGDSYYADAVLTAGRNRTDITRRIEYTIPGLSGGTTAISQIATGAPDSDQQSLALSFGRDFNRGALSFGPYLRGTYTRLDFDGYIERMSNPTGPGSGLALAVENRSLTSMQAVLGGKMSYAVSTSWGVLMPSLQIEYVKELKDDTDGLVTRFAFDPTNTSILIDGDEIDTDYLNIGLGLSGVFANGRSGYVYYEHVAGRDRTSQDSLAIGIRIEF